MIKFLKKIYKYSSSLNEPELDSLEFVLTDSDCNVEYRVAIDKEGIITLLDCDSISTDTLQFVLEQSRVLFEGPSLFVEKENPTKEDIVVKATEKL